MIEIEHRALMKFAPRTLVAPLRRRTTLSEIFHENTKLADPLSARAYSEWIGSFTRSPRVKKMLSQPYKVYTLMDREELVETAAESHLEQTIQNRRSVRTYGEQPIHRDELSRLLFYTYGRTDKGGHYRAVGSGGALYPLEIYALVLDVTGLDPGIYHYNAEDHHLDAIRRGDISQRLQEVVSLQGIAVETASVVLIVTALFRRCTIKYQDRGYRMILMEAGAAAQNLSLMATSLGIASCQVGGFDDNRLSELLYIDGVEEAPLVPIVLGRMPDDGATSNGEAQR